MDDPDKIEPRVQDSPLTLVWFRIRMEAGMDRLVYGQVWDVPPAETRGLGDDRRVSWCSGRFHVRYFTFSTSSLNICTQTLLKEEMSPTQSIRPGCRFITEPSLRTHSVVFIDPYLYVKLILVN